MLLLPSGCYILALKKCPIFIQECLIFANISNACVELAHKKVCLQPVSPDQALQ